MNNLSRNMCSLGTVIRQLMDESGIRESELARQTGLPQTTINRMLLGGTGDPRANTLKPIADYFGVTIGQLCGFEPLSAHRIRGTVQPTNRATWRFIPIIEWEHVKSWLFTQKNTTPLQHQHWISTERLISDHSFALYSLSSMEPRFRKNSILIVDPEAKYKDGHFIVVALDGLNPTVRKIQIDGADTLLKPFDQTQPVVRLSKQQIIYGTIVESRIDTYYE